MDFPPELVKKLTDQEAYGFITTWRNGWEALLWMDSVHRRHELVRLALIDLDTAVQHLSNERGDRGLARWSSLQAVEKMLKGYIALRNATFKRSHDPGRLTDQAEGLGLPSIARPWLAMVQCSAGARYGTEQSTLESAVTAQQAALGISAHVARSIRKTLSAPRTNREAEHIKGRKSRIAQPGRT